jgi:hypothetical protein
VSAGAAGGFPGAKKNTVISPLWSRWRFSLCRAWRKRPFVENDEASEGLAIHVPARLRERAAGLEG